MDTERNRQAVRRYYEAVLNGGAVDELDTLAVEDYEEHDPLPGQAAGREGLKQRVGGLRSSLRQQFTVEQLVAEGDLVVARWTATGTHAGEFFGIPPTGRSFTTSGIDIHRLRDGRLAEHWHEVDVFGLLAQLGAIPQPGEPAGRA